MVLIVLTSSDAGYYECEFGVLNSTDFIIRVKRIRQSAKNCMIPKLGKLNC